MAKRKRENRKASRRPVELEFEPRPDETEVRFEYMESLRKMESELKAKGFRSRSYQKSLFIPKEYEAHILKFLNENSDLIPLY